jgi:ribosome-associated protein
MIDLPPLALACHAASLCDGKSAESVSVLQLPPGCEFTYVVLATARSERQAYALVDEMSGFCKRYKIDHRPVEGEAGWYLIDCHQVVVHALGEDQRAFYNFEKLWKKAEVVDWQAELAKLPALPAPPKAKSDPE